MKTVINIKTDRDVKLKAKKLAEELGLPLSVVINAYLRQFVRNKGVYFSVIPQMSKSAEKLLGVVEGDLKSGKHLSRAFSSSKEMDDHLDSL